MQLRAGMGLAGTAQPDSDPVVERLLIESRSRQGAGLLARERAAEVLVGLGFLAAAAAVALAVPEGRPLDLGLAVALVALYALAARVEFHTGAGWTVPTQLVFVPMLFLLPPPAVPVCVAAGLLLSKLPEYWSGVVRADRALNVLGDAWYAIGPALVLGLAGAPEPSWGDWPLYLGALGAQFGSDLGASLARGHFGLGVASREMVRELRGVYLVDALLSPVGLLAAFAVADYEWAFLALAPLLGVLAIFAREREARIENALALSHAYRGTAHLLGELLTSSHEYTGGHSHSVVGLTHEVAVAMGLDERALREVELGALLHDVGKIAIPNEILDKPAALTDEEFALVKTHTVEGQRMLDRVGGTLAEAGRVVRSHHERWDGGGYPDGLSGEEIPVAARVISCCDAFHAMTSDRAYRKAMPMAAAIAELRTNAGTQFDPAVVDALIGVVTT